MKEIQMRLDGVSLLQFTTVTSTRYRCSFSCYVALDFEILTSKLLGVGIAA